MESIKEIFEDDVNDTIQKFLQNLYTAKRIPKYDEKMFKGLSVLAMNKIHQSFQSQNLESATETLDAIKLNMMCFFSSEESFVEFTDIMTVIQNDSTRKMVLHDLATSLTNTVGKNLPLFFQKISDNLKK